MCLSVFLATPQPVASVAFSAGESVFHAEPITHDYEEVRKQFSLPHVTYLGAHTECSCGFLPEGDEVEGEIAAAASRNALAEYVTDATTGATAEMFVCWEGDFAKPPIRHISITAPELGDRSDWLDELTFIQVAMRAS